MRPVNHARFLFLGPRAPGFWGDRHKAAADTVAILRAEAGRSPHDRALIALVGELSTRSEEFRALWAAHDVKHHRTGSKAFHHPVVGPLAPAVEALELPGDTRQTILTHSAEPGTPSADALALRASWAATADRPERTGTDHVTDRT